MFTKVLKTKTLFCIFSNDGRFKIFTVAYIENWELYKEITREKILFYFNDKLNA